MRPKRSRSRSTASDPGAPRGPAQDPSPLDVAAGILRAAPRTAHELHARLVARGYQPETAGRVVARCRELAWVDDALFALDRARALRRRGHGPLRIVDELEARGVAATLVDAAVRDSADGHPESAWARRALEREAPRTRAAAWRLLAARGFPEDVVADVLGILDD